MLIVYFWSHRHTGWIITPTFVVGNYYFREYLESHKWFYPLQPQPLPSLPYCQPGIKRPYHIPRISRLENMQDYNTAYIHAKGHLLHTNKDSMKVSQICLFLMICNFFYFSYMYLYQWIVIRLSSFTSPQWFMVIILAVMFRFNYQTGKSTSAYLGGSVSKHSLYCSKNMLLCVIGIVLVLPV